MDRSRLPVIVIGAGPIGLAAAAHLLRRGAEPLVLEAGASAGANIAQWAHVKVFSPWEYNVDAAARALLEAQGWAAPPAGVFPTGREILDDYLLPLARLPEIARRLRTHTRVTGVARQGLSRDRSAGRERAPFVVQAEGPDGPQALLARAVIDASGTYAAPNPLGGSGLPALGERALGHRFFYGIPDVLGGDRARYAGKRVLVAGSGHSAFNSLLDLARLAESEPGTTITWVVRRARLDKVFGGGEADELPERGRLGQRLKALLARGALELALGFATAAVTETSDGLVVSDGARALRPVDEIVVATGFRPDLDMLRELRLALDESVESPTALAPLIDPNVHSCGTVPPHGAEELKHPEADFFVVGMKSYGRAPTFLLRTGYEQVRSVALALTGDWEAARRVELVLPETGVCCSDPSDDNAACCAPAAAAAPASVPVAAAGLPAGARPVELLTLTEAPRSKNGGGCC